MSDAYLPPSRLDQERERVVAELSSHFAHDNLDTAEFETRLDLAYRATTLEDLAALCSDLPAVPSGTAVTQTRANIARPEDVRDRQYVVAIMGGTERKGAWAPARSVEVVAVMGGVELDFRDAVFPPGVTQINVLALMGGVEIIVPPDVRVESNGFGIMGGFASLAPSRVEDPTIPVLRISGVAIMGGVDIDERLPGENSRDAARRRKEERRRLRDQARSRGRLRPGDEP